MADPDAPRPSLAELTREVEAAPLQAGPVRAAGGGKVRRRGRDDSMGEAAEGRCCGWMGPWVGPGHSGPEDRG